MFGIGDREKHAFAERRLVEIDGGVGEVQRLFAAIEAGDFAAFQLLDERRGIRRDHVDEVLIESLAVGIGSALPHGLLRRRPHCARDAP